MTSPAGGGRTRFTAISNAPSSRTSTNDESCVSCSRLRSRLSRRRARSTARSPGRLSSLRPLSRLRREPGTLHLALRRRHSRVSDDARLPPVDPRPGGLPASGLHGMQPRSPVRPGHHPGRRRGRDGHLHRRPPGLTSGCLHLTRRLQVANTSLAVTREAQVSGGLDELAAERSPDALIARADAVMHAGRRLAAPPVSCPDRGRRSATAELVGLVAGRRPSRTVHSRGMILSIAVGVTGLEP